MDPYDAYRLALAGTWHQWWITWPLSRKIAVGQVYDASGGSIRSAGNLTDQGISLDLISGAPPSSYKYDSSGLARVRFKMAGGSPTGFTTLSKAEAGALVEFQGVSSVLIIFHELSQNGLRDTRALAATLVGKYWQGRWQDSFAAVTDVISVAHGIVLVAAGKQAAAELRLDTSIGQTPLTLVQLATNASISRSERLGLEWIGKDITPLFHVVRIRKTWLGMIKVEYGPPHLGRQAVPTQVPKQILEQARDSPDDVLETLLSSEQPVWD